MLEWSPLALEHHPTIEIVYFSHADISEIHAVEVTSSAYPWSKENFLSSVSSKDICLGLRCDERWVGHAVFSMVIDQLEVMIITLLPEYRRKGIARAFLSCVIRKACKQGAQSVLLEVRASNHAAIGLYKKMGFVEVGRRVGYYRIHDADKGHGKAKEDALLFTLELGVVDPH